MLEQDVGTIAVIDFGGQYTHLIARRVRNLNLFSRIYQPEQFEPGKDSDVVGVILSGGPRSVTSEQAYSVFFTPSRLGMPILGICYGHQLIASMEGGEVRSGGAREYGVANVKCDCDSLLFHGLEPDQTVWMSHGDHVDAVPPGYRITASSDELRIAAYESADGRVFGLQFHPEVTHTANGLTVLDNFLSACVDHRPWNARSMTEQIVRRIRDEAGESRIFLLVSGGVDSLVALKLCIDALGEDRVISLHVDNGLMRLGESAQIMDYLADLGFRNLHIANASGLFLEQLAGVAEPEAKRKVIGRLFVEVLNSRLADLELGDDWKLVQGTIYPDTIESGGTDKAAVIKTHHNRVAEIERMIEEGRVIEPLKDLYKDEVRILGEHLGLPEHLLNRHPFPGPGLGIRVLCSDGSGDEPPEEGLASLLADYGLEGCTLPVRSVGVQGDARTYHHPAVVWFAPGVAPGWNVLTSCAARVINRLKTVNRAVFSRRPVERGELSLGKQYATKETLDLLRQVDAVVRRHTDSIPEIWQAPVVILPLFDHAGNRAFVLRPICSRDAMTADVYAMDFGALDQLITELEEIPGVGPILYDLTTKPPGTIEWE